MIDNLDEQRVRTRAALTTLSTVGAATAGVGIGVLLASALAPLAWSIIGVGVISHLVGMVGLRRRLSTAGFRPAIWQQFAYWVCWAAIGALVLFVLWNAVK